MSIITWLGELSGVTDKDCEILAKNNIVNNYDLLKIIPIRYEDFESCYKVADLVEGMIVNLEGEILSSEVVYRSSKFFKIRMQDVTGVIDLVFFHFYPNYIKTYRCGVKLRVHGQVKYDKYTGINTIVHPKVNVISDIYVKSEEDDVIARLSPVYPTISGITVAKLAKYVSTVLAKLQSNDDFLPESIINKYSLVRLGETFINLHKPQNNTQDNSEYINRLKFDELLSLQLFMHQAYQSSHKNIAYPLKSNNTLTLQLFQSLPFELTIAQSRVIAEISSDIAKTTQMNRLLQGDVGSGKTIVALFAMLVAIEAGFQTCIMAPTEILALQHFTKISKLLDNMNVRIGWLSGSLTKKNKLLVAKQIENNELDLIIGTHAVFQDGVEFANLGLVVIDEQHRFGVKQRLLLKNKGINPHQLMMSATPIPRTLALSYYADQDLSVIDELPPNRTPIVTLLVNNNRINEVYDYIRHHLSQDTQVYWVCPLIEESEKLKLENATDVFAKLQIIFPDVSIGLIHGKLSGAEKKEIMEQFSRNEIKILVATVVIEVGVDVPNASIMVINNSERMGLAQLHQLRGRVGRGHKASSCILLYGTSLSDTAKSRLRVIKDTTDGFEVARQDLLIRGPGELIGARQSGLPTLKFSNLEEDRDLLEITNKLAGEMIVKNSELSNNLIMLNIKNQEYVNV